MYRQLIICVVFFLFSADFCLSQTTLYSNNLNIQGSYTAWLSSGNGATHTWQSSGSWDGSAYARFTPPTTCPIGDNGDYAGISIPAFSPNITGRINMRWVTRFSQNYNSTSRNCPAGYGGQNKYLIVETTGTRGMILYYDLDPNYDYTWCVCEDNDTCGIPKTFWSEDHGDEWITMEYEHVLATNTSKLYLWNRSGTISGVYATQTAALGQITNVQILGGFYNGYHIAGSTVDFDDIIIVKDGSTYIGPPEGFVGGTTPTIPGGVVISGGAVR